MDQDGDMPQGAREASGALGKTIDDFNRRQAEDGNNAQYKDFQDLGSGASPSAITHPHIGPLVQSQKSLNKVCDDFSRNNTAESRARVRESFGNYWGNVAKTAPSPYPFAPYDWSNVTSGLRRSLTQDPL